MASSFITKDDQHGFWIDDALMQVACWGLVNVIDKTPMDNENHWLKDEMRNHIFNNSQGMFVGFMHLRLADYLIDENRTEGFNFIILKAKLFFEEKGYAILSEQLNAFQVIKETKRVWHSSLETHRVIKILTWLEDVVNDKIRILPEDDIDYEF